MLDAIGDLISRRSEEVEIVRLRRAGSNVDHELLAVDCIAQLGISGANVLLLGSCLFCVIREADAPIGEQNRSKEKSALGEICAAELETPA